MTAAASPARATLLHLRFPFVLVLAPIFVWGARWGAGGWSARTTLGFLLVHLALYPGANAFNSAYDRDEGPIGGLARPPAVPRCLAGASALLQGAGLVLAPLVGLRFALAYALLWGVFTAYSHPSLRWKASPVASTAAIVLGQGGLGFLLGAEAAGAADLADPRTRIALAGAAAGVAALYPWTQVYQVEADRARSDRTLASILGSRGTLAWGAAGLAAFAACAAALGETAIATWAAAGAAAAGLAAAIGPKRAPSHRAVMSFAYANSAALLFLLALA